MSERVYMLVRNLVQQGGKRVRETQDVAENTQVIKLNINTMYSTILFLHIQKKKILRTFFRSK